jgi:glycosyltransferase involved in cell wall biosynthesis/SAM-dependent methyltransferase
MPQRNRKRLLVFIVAYNAESTIREVLARIPASLGDEYAVEILIIDDASQDRTFEASDALRRAGSLPFPLTVLFNPDNQGYGGNQKIGYHFAIKNGFDFVALLHGDGQYAPERLPALLGPLREGTADAVFGSRMLDPGAALKGRMPLYKFVGNKILTWFENRMLRTTLSEFHSGYRVFATAALERIPFHLNTNDFHFDTEIIVQLVKAGLRVREVPIPTYYGDEICRVNGLKYAWNVARTVLLSRAQEMSLFYDPRFDCAPRRSGNEHYEMKDAFESPHTATMDRVAPGSRVLDLGCAGGYMGAALQRRRGCTVTGVDMFAVGSEAALDTFVLHDLSKGPPPLRFEEFDYVLMLDVIEHLPSPELFVQGLLERTRSAPHITILVSTGNIGFFVTRLMLLAGQFNYGKRGILDLTHTRLFTFASLRRLFEQAGFEVIESRGVPAPFPLAVGSGTLGRFLLRFNTFLIRVARRLFSYQIFMVIKPRPSLEYLLQSALHHSASRAEAVAEGAEGAPADLVIGKDC